MPYIDQRCRRAVDPYLESILDNIDTMGEANYAITRIVTESKAFLPRRRYLSVVLVLGTLCAVALEYYRRLAAPYEDDKCDENGDLPGYTEVLPDYTEVHQPDWTPGTARAIQEGDR